MSDLESTDWSEIAANNIQPSPAGWPPNSSPNIVYTTSRESMGAIKRAWNRQNATVTAGGTPNALTLTFTSAPLAYIQGQRYAFIASANNTGITTLNVNGLGVKNIFTALGPCAGGELVANNITEVVYDGTRFQIVGGSGGALTMPNLTVNGPAGTQRNILGQTSLSNRWNLILGTATAEGGSDAGSDFQISRYHDNGTFIDAPFVIVRATGATSFRCSNTNDTAGPGIIGEVISSNVTSGVSLTTNVVANITSISLTAGDWNVQGEVWFAVGTGGATAAQAAIGSVSVTIPTVSALNSARMTMVASFGASNPLVLPLRSTYVSLAATTTYYLVASLSFPSGTCTGTGNIWARRAR